MNYEPSSFHGSFNPNSYGGIDGELTRQLFGALSGASVDAGPVEIDASKPRSRPSSLAALAA